MARWVVMPVYCHSRHAGMTYSRHWIPAFAGRLRASCPLTAYRTSCPYNDGGGFRLSPDGYRPPRPLVQDAALPPASLQGSLRWNDNGGYHHSGKSRHPATPSFRRRPESSGLHKPFPHSGNDNQRSDKPARHPPEPAIPSFLRPALLDSSAARSRRRSITYVPVGGPSPE